MRTRVYKHAGNKERLFPNTPLTLVSRFNLFHENFSHLATEEWDAKRAAAFRKYLLPSILRQRIKPDAFYMLIDEVLRDPVAELIEDLKRYTWIKPTVIPRSVGFNNYAREVHRLIESDFPARDGLICSRVDSDDSLNTHYFNTLEACIRDHVLTSEPPPPLSFIHFPYGLIKDGDRYRVYVEHQTAFVSSYSLGSGPVRTCCGYAHDKMSNAGPVLEIATEMPMWLYVRHEENIGYLDPFRFPISGQFETVAPMFGLIS